MKGQKKCGHVDRRKIGKRQKEDGKGQRRFGNAPKKVQKGSKEGWERGIRTIVKEVCELGR